MSETRVSFEHRDVQSEASAAIREARYRGESAGLVDMATGLGKTYIAALDVADFLRQQPDARIIYLCHNTEILRQARQTFEQVLGKEVGHGNVFEGQSNDQQQIVYASFQTLNGKDKLYQALSPDEFSYVVDDESHHAMAPTHLEVLEYLNPQFLLGLSATPERRDGRDIMDIFGSVLYRKTLEEALAEGLLTPVKYKTFTDNLAEITDISEILNDIGWDGLNKTLFIPKRDEEIAEILFDELAQIKDPHGLIYASSIEHAERIAKLLPDAAAIHSGLSPGLQRELTSAFRHNEIPLAVTIDKFNEGIDVPSVNFLAFLRSTTSLRIWNQQIGRGLRPYPGKDEVTVADLALSYERIQMILDLEDKIAQGRSQAEPERPRFINTPVEFEFSEEARNAIRLIKKARDNYERSKELVPKPYKEIGDLCLRFRFDGNKPDKVDYHPSETLAFRHIWESSTGSVTNNEIQQAHMVQFREKRKIREIRENMHGNMESFGAVENIPNFSSRSGFSARGWRLSNNAILELYKKQPFAESYDQAHKELLGVISDLTEQAREKKPGNIRFLDLQGPDNNYDQIRLFFDGEGNFRINRHFGLTGRANKTDLTGPEIIAMTSKDIEAIMSWARYDYLYYLGGETVINQSLVTAELSVTGPQIPEDNKTLQRRKDIQQYSHSLKRMLTPGEIRNISDRLRKYELSYVYTQG